MSIRAVSAPNIALIKYWGNRNEHLRLPAADSLSMTLDSPSVEVVVEPADTFFVRSFDKDDGELTLAENARARLSEHFTSAKQYLTKIGTTNTFPSSVSIEIHSKIPSGVGLASSAAIFSALAEVYAGFDKLTAGGVAPNISRRDVSILARLGSGSASRSVFGGFVAMLAGNGEDVGTAYAEQIAPQDHWKLWDIIIVPDSREKTTGSTQGHALAHTSPFFAARMREMSRRQKECIDAVLSKDFEKLQVVSEEDCLDMHAVMRSSTPSLDYLSAETHRIVSEIKDLRSQKGLAVLFTMDAGPTVHLICDESALPAVREYAKTQTGCTIFEATVGNGSRLI